MDNMVRLDKYPKKTLTNEDVTGRKTTKGKKKTSKTQKGKGKQNTKQQASIFEYAIKQVPPANTIINLESIKSTEEESIIDRNTEYKKESFERKSSKKPRKNDQSIDNDVKGIICMKLGNGVDKVREVNVELDSIQQISPVKLNKMLQQKEVDAVGLGFCKIIDGNADEDGEVVWLATPPAPAIAAPSKRRESTSREDSGIPDDERRVLHEVSGIMKMFVDEPQMHTLSKLDPQVSHSNLAAITTPLVDTDTEIMLQEPVTPQTLKPGAMKDHSTTPSLLKLWRSQSVDAVAVADGTAISSRQDYVESTFNKPTFRGEGTMGGRASLSGRGTRSLKKDASELLNGLCTKNPFLKTIPKTVTTAVSKIKQLKTDNALEIDISSKVLAKQCDKSLDDSSAVQNYHSVLKFPPIPLPNNAEESFSSPSDRSHVAVPNEILLVDHDNNAYTDHSVLRLPSSKLESSADAPTIFSPVLSEVASPVSSGSVKITRRSQLHASEIAEVAELAAIEFSDDDVDDDDDGDGGGDVSNIDETRVTTPMKSDTIDSAVTTASVTKRHSILVKWLIIQRDDIVDTVTQKREVRLRLILDDFIISGAPDIDGTVGHDQAFGELPIDIDCPEKWAILRDDWAFDSPTNVGDTIQIIGNFGVDDTIVIDNAKNMIIVEPDHLVPTTRIAETFQCARRAVLGERVHVSAAPTPSLVFGNMKHELLQGALLMDDFSTESLKHSSNLLVSKFRSEIHTLGIKDEEAYQEMCSEICNMQLFAELFIGQVPSPQAIIQLTNGHQNCQDYGGTSTHTAAISKVIDIEENIWSPRYGIKGKVDATVEIRARKLPASGSTRKMVNDDTLLLPLELKTGQVASGHGAVMHRAQVLLYSLLMSDRYNTVVANGLLYYMKGAQVSGVTMQRDEIRGIVLARNRLAFHNSNPLPLPSMVRDSRTCDRCYQKANCMLYHLALEGGDANSSGVPQVFRELTKHLDEKTLDYFRTWDKLISIEEDAMSRFRRNIWRMTGWESEQAGYCFSHMVLVSFNDNQFCSSKNRSNDSPKGGSGTRDQDNYCHYFAFRRDTTHPKIVAAALEASTTPTKCNDVNDDKPINDVNPAALYDASMSEGDMIVVSSECGTTALATGFVMEIHEFIIVVALDRSLRGPPLRISSTTEHQEYVGRRRLYGPSKNTDNILGNLETNKDDSVMSDGKAHGFVYRIDRDEVGSGMARIRNNLNVFCTDKTPRASRLRELISLCRPPHFASVSSIEHTTALEVARASSLNIDQIKALEKVLSASDYALILGMPGTGKTTTISSLVKVLVKCGKSVLLTSYTHSAVDTILIKLKRDNIDFLRLGKLDKIHPDIHSHTGGAAGVLSRTELEKLWNKSVVATTCLGINHPLFRTRSFDFCIVDEASQITQPVCLGPLMLAKCFILVGDHYQLPPLVRNRRDASEMKISLFARLCGSHPHAVARLQHQYRMNQDIMLLSNELVYANQLKCGNATIANSLLKVPTLKRAISSLRCARSTDASDDTWVPSSWLGKALDPENRVIFFDTDPIQGWETRIGHDSVTNDVEATLTVQLIKALLRAGVPATEIGAISPYRSQLKIIRLYIVKYCHDILTAQSSVKHSQSPSRKHDPCSHRIFKGDPLGGIEVNTVDKYQGRDKEVIIASLVRSNDAGNIGNLLKDWQRINVAITRARSKLIVYGSRSTLNSSYMLHRFLRLVNERGWLHTLTDGDATLFSTALLPISEKQTKETGTETMKKHRIIHGVSRAAMRGECTILGNIINGDRAQKVKILILSTNQNVKYMNLHQQFSYNRILDY